MKKVICIILSIIAIVLFTSCDFFKKEELRLHNLDISSDEKIAEETFEKILESIQEKNEKSLKNLFSTKALNEAENFETNMEYFFNLYQGELVSWTKSGGPSISQKNEYGTKTKRIVYWYDIKTSKENYIVFVLQYSIDMKDPENEGIYALRMIKEDDEATQFGYIEDMEIAGIYNPANMETPTIEIVPDA